MIEIGRPLEIGGGHHFIEEKERFEHLYLLGKTRSGKTSIFLNLISQELDHSIIVIDPVGGLANAVACLAPKDRLVYVDIDHPVVINPLSCEDWDTGVNEFIDVLNACVEGTTETKGSTVLMEEILLNALRVFNDDQKEIKYLSDFFNFEEKRLRHFNVNNSNKIPDEYWRFFDSKDNKGWLQNKEKVDSAKRVGARLSAFHVSPKMNKFVTGKNEFNVQDIIDKKLIYVFNLRGLYEGAKIYLGNLISHAIKSYSDYEAKEGSEPLFFYVDEFHKFITPFFEDMLAQCGKYNISVNFCHQNHDQITKALLNTALGNCLTKIVLSCGYDEAQAMANGMQLDIKKIQNLGKYEAYQAVGNRVEKISTYKPPVTEKYIPKTPPPKQELDFLQDGWITVI